MRRDANKVAQFGPVQGVFRSCGRADQVFIDLGIRWPQLGFQSAGECLLVARFGSLSHAVRTSALPPGTDIKNGDARGDIRQAVHIFH